MVNTELLSVSPNNEMAVLLRTEFVTSFDRRGMLARIPPMGGAARELLHDVHGAEWSRDGQQLAIVRAKQGMIRLEFPVGNVLYQTAGWISQLRISPDGQTIAIVDHASRNSDAGSIAVLDRKGERRVLSSGWGTMRGMAWSADGREIWFTADRGGASRGLYAISLEGAERRVLQLASNLTLHDVAPDGRILVGHGPERAGINGLAPGETRERDLSWLDWSLLQDITSDGRTILLDETAEGGGLTGSVYLRSSEGSPAIRLGDGYGSSISPDGEWAVTREGQNTNKLNILPTGVGEPRAVRTGALTCHNARFLPDNRTVVVSGHEPGSSPRLYRVDTHSGEYVALSPEGIDVNEFIVVPSRSAVLALNADQEHWLYPFDGGDPEPVPQLERSHRAIRWLPEENALLAYRLSEMPAKVYRIDLATGASTVWHELTPPDPTGIFRIGRVRASADGRSYGYSYYMQLVDLHVISGLH